MSVISLGNRLPIEGRLKIEDYSVSSAVGICIRDLELSTGSTRVGTSGNPLEGDHGWIVSDRGHVTLNTAQAVVEQDSGITSGTGTIRGCRTILDSHRGWRRNQKGQCAPVESQSSAGSHRQSTLNENVRQRWVVEGVVRE